MNRRDLLIAPAALAFAAGADAQIDSAPVRILVGAPAGGSTDTLARALAASMGTALGRAVIVENKTGAGGNNPPRAHRRARTRRPHAADELHQPRHQRHAVSNATVRSGQGLHRAHLRGHL